MKFIIVCDCPHKHDCKTDEDDCVGCVWLRYVEEQPLAGLGK